MNTFLILRKRSRTFSDLLHPSRTLWNVQSTRQMGGGPRTFPGGINKWQWKRLHEKKAREKEKKLLDQEKQLYHARIRSQIRSGLAGNPVPEASASFSGYGPMSPDEQVKALADRFMKEGAEDLWNDDDGPLKPPVSEPRSSVRGSVGAGERARVGRPIDLRSLVSENRGKGDDLMGFGGVPGRREYSVLVGRNENLESDLVNRRGNLGVHEGDVRRRFGRNESLESSSIVESDLEVGLRKKGGNLGKGMRKGDTRWRSRRNESSKSSSESDSEVGSVNRRGKLGKGVRKGDTKWRFKRSESSESSSESDSEGTLVKNGGKSISSKDKRDMKLRFTENESDFSEDDNDDSDSDSDYDLKKRSVRNKGSSASLGKYDRKITKRVPLKDIEKECNFADEVEVIRRELAKKKLESEELEKDKEESILSEKRFDESGISPLTVKALCKAGFIQMTRVQEATLSACLEGKDALIKSRSGTGKSAAFLLPAIETVLKAATSASTQRISPILVLVLCPTRELASQIAAEANVLLKYHDGVGVQTLVGGTRFKIDQKRLESDPCQIIVATPGRLLDHLETRSGLSVRLMGLKMLIVDEADHLLDLGFRKDLEKIVDCMPRQRQSMLFSATIPKEVRRVSQLILKRDHVYIDTVGLGAVETPAKIKQSFLVAAHESHFQIIHHLISVHKSQVPDYKVIVFCTTGMVTSLLYLLLREMKLNVRELHSRKPQLYRTRISEEFRESKQQILITSDVSARGLNYPDVTLVIQVGIPTDREQYIHRLGRTGRGGKDGEGILLLAPWEEYFVDELNDLPLKKFPSPNLDPDVKLKIGCSMAKIDTSSKEAAYHAWLGYYNSLKEIGRDKTTLVELANQFAQSIGLERAPALFRKTAVKMGLKDIPGIRIRK